MPVLKKIGAACLAAFGYTTGASTVSASYLIVAGGGGASIGGGGAGGYKTGTTSLNPTLSYTVTVGAGGAGRAGTTATGVNGSDSVFNAITSTGGGGGGWDSPTAAGSGGSGGGAGSNTATKGFASPVGQGNDGGSSGGGTSPYAGGGGGGAGAVGGNGSGSTGGAGGNGLANSISGSSVTYAGGGGAGLFSNGTGGAGGTGGGGAGANSGNGNPGTANLGGGGGGAVGSSTGGQGGSGVVIISYAGAQQFGGGVVTSVGGNTIHTFTTSGTLSPINSLSASYLVVAGGGGGGAAGGGGGAGGLLAGSGLTIDTNSIYLVTVGAGGSGGATSSIQSGVQGSSSSFYSVSTTGGGFGSGATQGNGGNGGSGGGAGFGSGSGFTGGTAVSGQGFAGGNSTGSTPFANGGGGGAGAVGAAGSGSQSGNGGNGASSSISGTAVTYAGGGGGGGTVQGTSPGTGGTGGGATGQVGSGTGFANSGTANTGGGGGGGSNNNGGGGTGGSGIVIISYPGSTPQMAGGTVTAAGGNIIHTFTSSGFLTPITNLTNSLRFRSSASAFLNRTPTVAGNQQRFTLSAWVKRGQLGTFQNILSLPNNNTAFRFTDTNLLGMFFNNGNDGFFGTNAVFRDPSAWYHIVLAIDTTQATNTNRIILYVNGVQQTFSSVSYPSQNYNTAFNTAVLHRIGQYQSSEYFDGYMADVNLIDGQQLTPSSFGAFNGQGVWQPVRYGGSYGTNGFYLPFTGATTFAGGFNGSSQGLFIPYNANFGTNDFTAEGWYYFNSVSATNNPILFYSGNGSGSVPKVNMYFSSSGVISCSVTLSGGPANINSSISVTTGQWYHVALVRSSGVLTLYVNGQNAGSVANTVNLTGITGGTAIGQGLLSDGTFVNGIISNVRFNSTTAIYTKAFNPPTSPLTAVSGTQILTLQNATIVDNSTNAFSITNNGTVTTSSSFPFIVSVAQDYSPQSNNWAVNNFGSQSTSGIDYMTDVPTNTSATVANYAVLNPLQNVQFGGGGSIVFANGNLKVSNSASGQSFGSSTISVSSGKFYAEMTFDSNTSDGFTGVWKTPINASSLYYQLANTVSYYSGGQIYFGSSTTGTTYNSYTTGDVIGIALDMDTGKVYFSKNGTWQGSSDPATGTNPAYSGITGAYQFGCGQGGSGGSQSFNFGQQPFRYTPPSGFVALNTFNLPTPTIGATPATTANKYMDISLWSGDGVDGRSITNSNTMQPDFVWVKSRSSSDWWNVVFDSVRGAGNQLATNVTDSELASASNIAGKVSAFNSNGFSLAKGSSGILNGLGSVNGSGVTYVGWQWRASNATAVTNTSGSITSTVSANTTAGFSIVTYTGNLTAAGNATIGHGLGVAPSLIITKRRDGTSDWIVQTPFIAQNKYLQLNTTAALEDSVTVGAGTLPLPTSTTFGSSWKTGLNINGQTFVAYCFAAVAGYSAFGSYTGNGSTDGPFIYTGFRPRFILWKKTNSATNAPWVVVDTSRSPYNLVREYLLPNSSDAETSFDLIDILSNGYKWRSTAQGGNNNGDTYIYAAFAESPFKYANAR